MLRIVIAEDDPGEAAGLAGLLRRYEHQRGVPLELRRHADGAALVAAHDGTADLLLLDVEMPGTDGMDAAAQIRARDRRVAIAFVTHAADRAVQGYRVDALDYLVKPVGYEALARTVDRARARAAAAAAAPVVLELDTGALRLDAADIVALEAAGRHVVVRTLDGRHRARGPLKDVAARLDGHGFHRCHHGYVVNLRHVVAARPEACTLVTGLRVPVSRPRRAAFLAALADHLASAPG